MQKIFLIILGIILIMAIAILGIYYYFQSNSRYPEGAQRITKEELNCGGYWGADKKIGTPNNWVHDAVGSQNEQWHRPFNWDGWTTCLYK